MSAARRDVLIPLASGQAISRGWPSATGGRPHGVTWHWTATWDLALCRRVLGGPNAERKGQASAHYGVGRTFAEGIDRYVTLDNRSWHAGIHQLTQVNGRAFTPGMQSAQKGTRTTIGVETVSIGYARAGVPARPGWLRVARTDCKRLVDVQPWTDEQIEMMIDVGKEIGARWPHIGPRDHHGHHDLCPNYKDDVVGFPFAAVLRGIYDDDALPDVWTPLWMPAQRQRVLAFLDYDLGPAGVDGDWGTRSDLALRAFQRDIGLEPTGRWSTWVSWAVQDRVAAAGKELVEVAGEKDA